MSLTRWLMFLLGVILVCLTRQIPLSDAVEVVTAEIRSLDPRFALLVPPNAKLERIADGFTWVEGPVWNKEGGFLLFSDIPANRVYKWKAGEGVSVYLERSGYSGPSSGSSNVGRLEKLEGRVEYVDSRRGTLEIRDRSNRLVVVSLPYNAPRAVSERLNRLREGDYVRMEGRFLNRERFELENFV